MDGVLWHLPISQEVLKISICKMSFKNTLVKLFLHEWVQFSFPCLQVIRSTTQGWCPASRLPIQVCLVPTQACPVSILACPRNIQACPRNIQACPHNIQGCPRYSTPPCPRISSDCRRALTRHCLLMALRILSWWDLVVAWCPISVLDHTLHLHMVSRLGVGVTKPTSSVPLFSEFFSVAKTHVCY